MEFDEVMEFDQVKFEDNIARHEFAEPDKLDGKGVVDDESRT